VELVKDIKGDADKPCFVCKKYKYSTARRFVFLEEERIILRNQNEPRAIMEDELRKAKCRTQSNVICAVLTGRPVRRKNLKNCPRNDFRNMILSEKSSRFQRRVT